MIDKTKRIAQEYAATLNGLLTDHLEKVILFGSRARGDDWEGSDYDMLVIVDKRTPAIREAITEAGARMMDKYNTLFAALSYSEEEWRHMQDSPLNWNIQKEGIAL